MSINAPETRTAAEVLAALELLISEALVECSSVAQNSEASRCTLVTSGWWRGYLFAHSVVGSALIEGFDDSEVKAMLERMVKAEGQS